jgi:hypothetical protein
MNKLSSEASSENPGHSTAKPLALIGNAPAYNGRSTVARVRKLEKYRRGSGCGISSENSPYHQ